MLWDGLGLFKKFFTQLSSPPVLQLFLSILSLGESHAIWNWHFTLFVIWGQTSKSAISVEQTALFGSKKM
jgi:hypothetical protein